MRQMNTFMKSVVCFAAFLAALFTYQSELHAGEIDAELYHSLEEKKEAVLAGALGGRVSIGALLEVEASVDDNDRSGDSSSLVLATVEVGIEAELSEMVSGHVIFLWEEETSDPIVVDEGVITLTHPSGVSLAAGRMYLPFGVFNTHFVSDPITLELGETNESAVKLGYARGPVELSAGAFKAGVDDGPGSKTEDWFASVTISPVDGAEAGAYYLSNMAETKWLSGDIGPVVSKIIDGWGAYASVEFGPVTLDAEFIRATRRFLAADHDGDSNGKGDLPRAWNVEAAWSIDEHIEAAIKAEGSNGFFVSSEDFPEFQFGAAVAYGLTPGVSITAEYLHGYYAGDKDERDKVSVQLAMSF